MTLFEPSYGLFQFMYHPLETVPDVGAVFQSVDNIVTIRYGATNVLNAKNKFKFGYEIGQCGATKKGGCYI